MTVKRGNIMGIVYWLINLGYAFKFWGLGWGLTNIFFPVALLWDGLQYVIKLIHPGLN